MKNNNEENYKAGNFPVFRSIFNHHIIGLKKPFSKFEAWLWMLKEATYKPEGRKKSVNFGGKERIIMLQYGEFAHSERFMSDAFGWSRDKIRRYISLLQSDFMLSQNQDQQISVTKVANYDKYNLLYFENNTSKQPASNQQATKHNKENKDNKENIERNINFPPKKEAVFLYAKENNLSIDTEYYFNSRSSTAWEKVNGQIVKNWKSDLLNAEKGNWPKIKKRGLIE